MRRTTTVAGYSLTTKNRSICALLPLLLESESFRAAPEGSIIPQRCTAAVMRAVSSLIQNHRHFTAGPTRGTRPPDPRSPRTVGVACRRVNTTFMFQPYSPLVVRLFDSLSGLSQRHCHCHGPPTLHCTPRNAH